jgi:Holliday junction resolvasome RuvABC endonuclease subunit
MQTARKTVLRLIGDLKPEILVVEKTYIANNKSSKLLNEFTAQVRTLGKQKGLQVHSFATNTVRKFVCGNGAASKDDAARAIVARYPELKAFLSQDRKWKTEFHGNMFDAIALGLFAINQHRGK